MTQELEEAFGRTWLSAALAEGHRKKLPSFLDAQRTAKQQARTEKMEARREAVRRLWDEGISSPTAIAKSVGASKPLVWLDLREMGLAQ